jgi:riboflavin synthase alpha subunit
MFTGLVREVGRLRAITSRSPITRLELDGPRTAPALAVGDSLAVDGICLTVTRLAGHRIEVEATAETRRVTTLARWTAGKAVHLEPSLRAGDPLGGHFVLGHVDGVGRVLALERRSGAARLRVALDASLASQLLPKGSVAVDGVSLTLDEGPFRGCFSITLVPHTLAVTRLGRLGPGDLVNLELDVLAKAARRPGAREPVVTLASLLARGWQTPR